MPASPLSNTAHWTDRRFGYLFLDEDALALFPAQKLVRWVSGAVSRSKVLTSKHNPDCNFQLCPKGSLGQPRASLMPSNMVNPSECVCGAGGGWRGQQ